MLLLLAELTALPGAAAEVEATLSSLAAVARTEAGNLAYAVHRMQEDPHRFVLYELYADRAACDAHLAAPPVRSALARFDSLLATPPRIALCDAIAGYGTPFDLLDEKVY